MKVYSYKSKTGEIVERKFSISKKIITIYIEEFFHHTFLNEKEIQIEDNNKLNLILIIIK